MGKQSARQTQEESNPRRRKARHHSCGMHYNPHLRERSLALAPGLAVSWMHDWKNRGG